MDIHGQSAKIDKIMAIARKYNLKVISDSAQAIGSKFKSKYTGTLSHIGGFSFNYHKHIHTGEGGVIITDDNKLAERMRLIRNHGEAVVFKNGITKINNILGHNFRLGEIEASIGIEQLKKLKKLVNKRSYQGEYLSESLKHLHGLKMPYVDKNNTHVFYVFPMIYDPKTGVSRIKIIEQLNNLGMQGLAHNLTQYICYHYFKKKIAYGNNNFPWSINNKNYDYTKGLCPVAEELSDNSFICIQLCLFELNNKDLRKIVRTFIETWKFFGLY